MQVRFPHLAEFARLTALIQPSSAVAERVFSFLANLFGSDRDCSLNDLVEASVIARCHFVWRKH